MDSIDCIFVYIPYAHIARAREKETHQWGDDRMFGDKVEWFVRFMRLLSENMAKVKYVYMYVYVCLSGRG